MKRLPRVYVIVDSADWIRRLLPVGMQLVQLRIKDRSMDDVRQEVRKARSLCEDCGAQLVINDHWRIALEEGCDFVHLGQADLDSADIPALREADLGLGISTHDSRELERALALQPDYIALGPIYPTRLKAMPWAPQGRGRIAQWKQRMGATPLVAIGGLSVERLAGVFAAGADSAAVVTDILQHPHPELRLREWLSEAASC